MTEKLDRFGAVASSLCAVHCAVCAFLPAALGALGLGFLIGHEAEWILSLIAISFAAVAAVIGYRQHGSKATVSLLVIGVIGLLASRGIEAQAGHHGEHGDDHHETADKHHDAKNKEHYARGAHDTDRSKAHHAKDDSDEHHAKSSKEAKQTDEHHEDTSEHDDATHLIGAGTGILAGFFLSTRTPAQPSRNPKVERRLLFVNSTERHVDRPVRSM